MKKFVVVFLLTSTNLFAGYTLTVQVYPTARDVTVKLYDASGDLVKRAVTSTDGKVIFSNIDAGVYYIVVKKMGHKWVKKVGITTDTTVDMNCEFTQFSSVGSGDFLYSFIIMTDFHVKVSKKAREKRREFITYIKDVLDDYASLDPRFVMITGDIADQCLQAPMETAKVILDEILDAGLFYIPLRGNHDVII